MTSCCTPGVQVNTPLVPPTLPVPPVAPLVPPAPALPVGPTMPPLPGVPGPPRPAVAWPPAVPPVPELPPQAGAAATNAKRIAEDRTRMMVLPFSIGTVASAGGQVRKSGKNSSTQRRQRIGRAGFAFVVASRRHGARQRVENVDRDRGSQPQRHRTDRQHVADAALADVDFDHPPLDRRFSAIHRRVSGSARHAG